MKLIVISTMLLFCLSSSALAYDAAANLILIQMYLGGKAPKILLESRDIVRDYNKRNPPIIGPDIEKKNGITSLSFEEEFKYNDHRLESVIKGIKAKFPDLNDDIVSDIAKCLIEME